MSEGVEQPVGLTHRQGVLLLVATAVLWSLGGLMVKKIAWHPLAISSARSLLALPVLMILFRFRDLKWSGPQIAGAVFYAASLTFYVMANKLTTAANTIVLQYTAPIYVALLSGPLLRERVNRRDWIAVVAAVAGMVLFFLDDITLRNAWGNALAILAGVTFAGMIVSLRMQKDGHPIVSVFLGNVLAGVIGVPFLFVSGPDAAGWAWLLLLGLVQVGLAYVLYSIAIRRVTALEGVMVPIIEPILNPLWVLLFYGEVPGPWAIPGGAIVVGAAVYSALARIGRPARPPRAR